MIYGLSLTILFFCLVSLGVDYGRVQMVKTQEARAADMIARGMLQIYQSWGSTTAYTALYQQEMLAANPVDAKSGLAPTMTIVWGTWDTTANAFTPGGTGPNMAVKVTISRSAGNNNAVPLVFGGIVGRRNVDVWASAGAAVVGGQSGSFSLPSTASLYLAGMPPGSITQGWGDNTTNATPYGVTAVPVVPGTYITLTNVSGQTSIVPGYVPNSDANGDTGLVLHHGQNYNSSPNPVYPNPENGFGDAKMQADALAGVFVTSANPNGGTVPTPAPVDWTDAAHANQPTYSNIALQEPFRIGNGQTTGGVTQQFLVPAGATQLYLGVWDGVCYSNNGGSLTGTVAVQQKIMVVQSN